MHLGPRSHYFLHDDLSDEADVLYMTADYYAPQHERCLIRNDPEVGIAWPLSGEPVLAAKDRAGLLTEEETFA